MTFQLILAGPDQRSVALSRKTSQELQIYKKNAVRFIYNSFVTGQPGALLNVDLDMNHEHICAVAISALYKKGLQNLPSVVLCSESRFTHWFYFLKKHSELEVYKITENNVERLLTRNEALVLIVTDKDHGILRNYVKDFNFFCLIADEIDLLCEKLITKQVQADFHLGIHHRNFIAEPDQQLQWKVINWTLKKSNKQFLKLLDFIEYDNAYLEIFVDPYSSFRHIITSDLCSTSERNNNAENKTSLLESIKDFAELHGFNRSSSEESRKKRKVGSKSPTELNKTKKSRKQSRTVQAEPEESFEHWTSDEDLPPDLSVFEISVISTPPSSASSIPANSPKKLRLKSPLNPNKPKDDFNSSFVEKLRPLVTKGRKLNFDDDLNKSDDSALRKTKSDRMIVLDKTVIDEFSLPFDAQQPSTSGRNKNALKATKSDSALIPNAKNVRLANEVQSALNELNDVEVLREFSEGFETTNISTKEIISQEALTSLLTNDISLCVNSTTELIKSQSQDNVVEQLDLYLSDEDSRAIYEEFKSQSSENVQQNLISEHSISSDDDIDNYMHEFLENMKKANKINPKNTESLKMSTNCQLSQSSNEKSVESQRIFSDNSDVDNFLRDFKSPFNDSLIEREIVGKPTEESSEEEDFLSLFLKS